MSQSTLSLQQKNYS